MRPLDCLNISISQVRKRPARSILTILGIVIGVAALMTVISVGEAGRNSVYTELEKLGLNKLIVYPYDTQTNKILTMSDVELLEEYLPSTAIVRPQAFWKGDVVSDYGRMTADIAGVTAEFGRDMEILDGRFLNDVDMLYARNVIVLSEEAALKLFNGDAVGREVRINGRTLSVVGVEKSSAYSVLIVATSYVPATLFPTIFGTNALSEISISVEEGGDIQKVTQKTINLLMGKHGKNSIKVLDLAEESKNADKILNVFQMVIGSVALVSLLVGGVGIMNIMLANVRERTREIGVLKAIGATDGAIMGQFVMEALIYSVIGAFLGVALGIGFSYIAGQNIGIPVALSPMGVFVAISFSCAVGLIFGAIPAYKAACLRPAYALRRES